AALIAAGTSKVQEAVAAHMISQEKADKIIARLPTIADKVVNHHKTGKAAGG
ncbi:MAG: hypothetical protein QOE63_1405, partial [Acidimicrobiaceae bacterium]